MDVLVKNRSVRKIRLVAQRLGTLVALCCVLKPDRTAEMQDASPWKQGAVMDVCARIVFAIRLQSAVVLTAFGRKNVLSSVWRVVNPARKTAVQAPRFPGATVADVRSAFALKTASAVM